MATHNGYHMVLAIACLMLRLVTMIMLAISIYLIATDTVSFSFDPNFEVKFQEIIGYRYLLATSCIGLVYTMLVMPITIFIVSTIEKKESIKYLIDVCSIGDMAISFLLATGVGAGFLVSIDLKRLIKQIEADGLLVPEIRTTLDKYFTRGIVATAFLLGGAIFMAITSIIAYVIRIFV